MAKTKIIKIYLEPEVDIALRKKVKDSGFFGKGAIGHYIEKIANNNIIFMDENLKNFAGMFNLSKV